MSKIMSYKSKFDYVKPRALDLGELTPLVGSSCSGGISNLLCSGGSENYTAGCESGGHAGACSNGSAENTPDT
jgi:hypothetical protein